MPRRKQVNIRLDSLTIETIKAIALKHNMRESQVVTRAIILLEQELKRCEKPPTDQEMSIS